jgi:AcrR family transcriptional regulator
MTQDTGARPQRRDAVRNQEQVLRAAHEVMAEYGTVASMELVATRAGVGVGTVYRHFANKETLIDEMVRRFMDELIDAARAALARGDGTGLEEYLRTLGSFFLTHRGYTDKLVGPSKVDASRVLAGLLADLLEQAKGHGRIGAAVTVADVRAATWALRGVIDVAGAIAPDAWERFLDVQLAGLRVVPFPSERPEVTDEQLDRIVTCHTVALHPVALPPAGLHPAAEPPAALHPAAEPPAAGHPAPAAHLG